MSLAVVTGLEAVLNGAATRNDMIREANDIRFIFCFKDTANREEKKQTCLIFIPRRSVSYLKITNTSYRFVDNK
jgi:hypothetical protein